MNAKAMRAIKAAKAVGAKRAVKESQTFSDLIWAAGTYNPFNNWAGWSGQRMSAGVVAEHITKTLGKLRPYAFATGLPSDVKAAATAYFQAATSFANKLKGYPMLSEWRGEKNNFLAMRDRHSQFAEVVRKAMIRESGKPDPYA